MARDPKLGYHWIWLYPVAYLSMAIQCCIAVTAVAATRIKSRMNDLRYPNLKNLRILAGIKGKRK